MKNKDLKELIRSKKVTYLQQGDSLYAVIRTGVKGNNALYKHVYLSDLNDKDYACFAPISYELNTHFLAGQEIAGADEITRKEFVERLKTFRGLSKKAELLAQSDIHDMVTIWTRVRGSGLWQDTKVTQKQVDAMLDEIEAACK